MKKKNKKGGFCNNENPCNNIYTNIDVKKIIEDLINSIFKPINFIITLIINGINKIIDYWDLIITRLSNILQVFVSNLFFSINGYINIFNIIINEFRTILDISLTILTNNPISLLSIYLLPVIAEIMDFILDSFSFHMLLSMFSGNFNPFINFVNAFTALLYGKTIKPNCNIDEYSNIKEMNENCHEYYLPKCRLNLRTLFNLIFYILLFIYISCWFSFLKIFYNHDSQNNIIQFIRNKFYNN